MKSNRIPRNFNRITARQEAETNAGKPGDIWHITRNNSGYLGLNTNTGEYFYIFASHLRIKEQWTIQEII